MRKILTGILVLLLAVRSYAQENIINQNSKYFKTTGYLEVCIDQLQTGIFISINDFNVDTLHIDSIKLVPLESIGFSKDLLFYEILIKYPNYKNEMSYTLCYNQADKSFFKLKGFYKNEYYSFFMFLERQGLGITLKNFRSKNIKVHDLDFSCLIEMYQMSKKAKRDILGELDRVQYDCFNYNFQPVVIY